MARKKKEHPLLIEGTVFFQGLNYRCRIQDYQFDGLTHRGRAYVAGEWRNVSATSLIHGSYTVSSL